MTDLEVGYALTDHITLPAGASNLLDVYPRKNGLIAVDGSGAYGNFCHSGSMAAFTMAVWVWPFGQAYVSPRLEPLSTMAWTRRVDHESHLIQLYPAPLVTSA